MNISFPYIHEHKVKAITILTVTKLQRLVSELAVPLAATTGKLATGSLWCGFHIPSSQAAGHHHSGMLQLMPLHLLFRNFRPNTKKKMIYNEIHVLHVLEFCNVIAGYVTDLQHLSLSLLIN